MKVIDILYKTVIGFYRSLVMGFRYRGKYRKSKKYNK